MAASSTDAESIPMAREELQQWKETVSQRPIWPTNDDYPCPCCNKTLGNAYGLIQHWQDSWSRAHATRIVEDTTARRIVSSVAGLR